MRDRLRLWRFAVGRWLMHLGLRVMPAGRARSELYSLMDKWSTGVARLVAADRERSRQHEHD